MIHIALVGAGHMSAWHAQQLAAMPEAKVVAVVAPTPERGEAVRERHAEGAAVYESFEALLAAPPVQLDAVVLVTPHACHFPQAKAALEHGLHVLVEKPMVTSSADAYELWATARRTNRLLGISFQSPYTAEFSYLATQRDTGALGTIQSVSGFVSQDWKALSSGTWRMRPELSGGGFMYDTGAHLLNAMLWLVNRSPIEVACFFDRLDTPVDVNGVAIVRFAGGAMGNVGLAGNAEALHTDLTIVTDTLLIRTDQYGKRLDITARDGKPFRAAFAPLSEPLCTPHHNFVAAILGREPLKVPARYGVLLSVLMDAMYESGDTGKVVKVKPVPDEL